MLLIVGLRYEITMRLIWPLTENGSLNEIIFDIMLAHRFDDEETHILPPR